MKYRHVPDDPKGFTKLATCQVCKSLDSNFDDRDFLDRMIATHDNNRLDRQ